MLSPAEIQNVLDRVAFLPGWTFTLVHGRDEGMQVRIQGAVENSYNPGENVLLDIPRYLHTVYSETDLLEWLLHQVKRIMIHETLEWFKIDGKPYRDPHRPHADRDGVGETEVRGAASSPSA